MAEVREPSYHFQDGQWHESTAHSGSINGPVREPSPDDDVIVVDRDGVEWVRHYSDGPVAWEAVDWAPIPGRVLTWADLCAKRDAVVYIPASRLAAAEAERDDLREQLARERRMSSTYAAQSHDMAGRWTQANAVIERVQAVYDGVHRKDSTLLCSIRCADLAAALAGTAPEETSTDE